MMLAATPGLKAADGALAAALERLHAAELAQRRAGRDLQARIAAGTISVAGRADYEQYLRSLDSTVVSLREDVERLQGVSFPGSPAEVVRSDAPESPDQRVSRLEASLQRSVGEFDEMLLREREELSRRRAATGDGGGAGGSSATGQGGAGTGSADSGWGVAGDGERNAGSAGEHSDTRGGVPPPAEQDASRDGALARAGGSGRGGAAGGTPADIPDGQDDDVVARQLREAAENEADPVLRERLWEEYRRYKASSR